MHALLLRAFGSPPQMQIEDLPTPTPGPDELLIEVHAAAINPSDLRNVAGGMHGTTLPRIPGRDFAGIVTQGPPQLLRKEVFGTGGDIGFTRDGSHAQFLLLPANAVVPKPPALSMDDAGNVGLTFVTAWSALVTAARIQPSDTVLIVGAAGGVGSAALQIAKAHGAKILAAVRSDEELAAVRQLGADHAINTRTTPLPAAVRSLTSDRGASLLFDTSGFAFPDLIDSAALAARIAVITAPPDGKTTFNLRTLYRNELTIHGVDTRKLDARACATLLTAMLPHFATLHYSP